MVEKCFSMLQVKTYGKDSDFFTLSEVAYRAGLHPELIDRFISLGLIEFTDSDGGRGDSFRFWGYSTHSANFKASQ